MNFTSGVCDFDYFSMFVETYQTIIIYEKINLVFVFHPAGYRP